MHDVVDIWCDFIDGVVDVLFYTRCGVCLMWWISYFIYVVVLVWCGGCPILYMV